MGLFIKYIKKTFYYNSSYAMRVSAVLQVQFPQGGFVPVDTDAARQSRTVHSCDCYLQLQEPHAMK